MTQSILNSILAFVRKERNRGVLSWDEFDGHLKSGHNMPPTMYDMATKRRFPPEFRRHSPPLMYRVVSPTGKTRAGAVSTNSISG
jgi:hypothetical protein